MVSARHTPESSKVSDDRIRRMIRDEVAATIREFIHKMFGSIVTTLIKTFDERYVADSEAAAVAAIKAVTTTRPRGGDSLLYQELSNTKSPRFDKTGSDSCERRYPGSSTMMSSGLRSDVMVRVP